MDSSKLVIDYTQAFLDDLPELLADKIPELVSNLDTLNARLEDMRSRLRSKLNTALVNGEITSEQWEDNTNFAEIIILEPLKSDIAKINLELRNLLTARSQMQERLGIKPKSEFTELIERAREVDVADVFPKMLRKQGNKQVAVCPFHNEDTPSFFLYEDNTWHCYGCGKHGYNAIDFVMAYENLDFVNAVRRLV